MKRRTKIPPTIRKTLEGLAAQEWDSTLAHHIRAGEEALGFMEMCVNSLKEARFLHLRNVVKSQRNKRGKR